MNEKKQSLAVGQGITLQPQHVSWIVAGGLVYSGLLFLTGYIIGQRKAVSTLLERFQAEQLPVVAESSKQQSNMSLDGGLSQMVDPAQSISFGYFGTPEKAHERASWAEQITGLTFKVCELSDEMMPNAVYHVISESCSNDAMLDTALKRLVPHQEQSECNQFRLIPV